MKILITEISDGRIVAQDIGKIAPVVGGEYILEDAREGTAAQNKFFHLLVGIFYRSNAHSYPADTRDELKQYILLDNGEGFEKYIYVAPRRRSNIYEWLSIIGKELHQVSEQEIWDAAWELGSQVKIEQTQNLDEIPEEIRKDRDRVMGRLKSWATYTLKQRKEAIGNLMTQMIKVGVKNEQFDQIVDEHYDP